MNDIEAFLEARNYLIENIQPTIDVYLCEMWDPLCQYYIFKELDSIYDKDFKTKFPDLKPYHRPSFKYRVFEGDEIEVNIQNYLHDSRHWRYLGSCSVGGNMHDLHYREAFDYSGPLFIARYGHIGDHYISGGKTAKAEYYLGASSPLSIAYGMAVHDGYIE